MIRRNIFLVCATLILLAICAKVIYGDVTVTIDTSKTHQTIDGFGAFGGESSGYDLSPTAYGDAAFMNLVYDTLGMTMVRLQMPTYYEQTNDNSDPNAFDTARIKWDAAADRYTLNNEIAYIKAIKAKEDQLGEPIKVIITSWSPEAWMKDNANIANGGSLLASMQDEYVEWVVEYLKIIKERTGKEIYAYSIQNEPYFVEWYISCVIGMPQMRDVTKLLGARIAKEGLTTKVFGCEDVIGRPGWDEYAGTVCADTAAAKYVAAMAIHGYDATGVTPSSGSINQWTHYKTLAAQYNKKVWMTEESGYVDTWNGNPGAMTLATGLYTSIKYGDLSGATWWILSESKSGYTAGTGGFIVSGTLEHSGRFYALRQFYRFVRPGMVRVECTSSAESTVGAIAFAHPTRGTKTVVLMNFSSASQAVSLNAPAGWTGFDVYQSSASQNGVKLAPLAGTSITLPATSITTLYLPKQQSVRMLGKAPGPVQRPGCAASGGAFLLDGRRAAGPSGRAPNAGAGIAIVKGRAVFFGIGR